MSKSVALVVLACLVGCSGGGTRTIPTEPVDPTRTTVPDPPPTSEGFELSDIVVQQNPEHASVLHVSWTQSDDAGVHLAFQLEGEELRHSPVRQLAAGEHEELILGIPFDTDVTWWIVAEGPSGEPLLSEQTTTHTGAAPANLPIAQVYASDPTGFDPEVDYLLVSVSYDDLFHGEYITVVLDRRGRAVWAYPSPFQRSTMHPRISWSSDSFLLDHGGYWGGDLGASASSSVVELKIDGTVVQERATPGLYHPFTDLPDGSLVYGRHGTLDADGDGTRDGDAVVRIAPDGTSTELFNCDDWVGEGCGANTLSYNPDQGVFLYSLFTHDTILELDADSGEVLRWYGQLRGAFAFDGAPFWYQHGAVYTDAGTLLTSTHRDEFDFELVVREYEVDEANERLVEIWSFGEGEGVVGRQMGEAHRLPSGNTLHNHGTHAVLREIDPAGDVVWDVRWEENEYAEYFDGHVVGRSAPITTDLYAFAPPRP